MLVNGAFSPRLSAGLGLIWVATRCMFGYGYANHGPKGRLLGIYLSLLGIYQLIGLTFVNAVSLLGSSSA